MKRPVLPCVCTGEAAETEADEGQDAGQTDENQSGESEAAQTDQTSAAGTGEGETTE